MVNRVFAFPPLTSCDDNMNQKKEPKTIGDVVSNNFMYPVSDNWYPSFGRGYKDEPSIFEECECLECLKIPSKDRQKYARWDWKDGGMVSCFLYVFDSPRGGDRTYNDPSMLYMARVSFWGMDDTGMEKYFQYEEDARRFVCHLPAYLSKDYLFDCGFNFC